jgi:hypothetical protein
MANFTLQITLRYTLLDEIVQNFYINYFNLKMGLIIYRTRKYLLKVIFLSKKANFNIYGFLDNITLAYLRLRALINNLLA